METGLLPDVPFSRLLAYLAAIRYSAAGSTQCPNVCLCGGKTQVTGSEAGLSGKPEETCQLALWWREADASVRASQVPRARRYLRWILAVCPEDKEAWLLLARLASSLEARLAYLRQAYRFHPGSPRLQAALRQARREQLESSVGDLKVGHSVLRCLPDERALPGRPDPRPETEP
jgi:hypothetical protein